MIIKYRKIINDTFVYENNSNLEGVHSYKYLRIHIHHKRNWNYNIEKKINGGWKAYYKVENNYKLVDFWIWDNKKFLFMTLVTLFLYGCKVWG